jgi:hypothetical protein
MTTEASVWNEEQKTNDWTEYYIVLADGEKKVSFILKHNSTTKEVVAEPYSPPDINYTIHDGCDHENYGCVLDDPDSFESQDVNEAERYSSALNRLEAQVKQQRVASSLVKAKEELEDKANIGIGEVVTTLLKDLPVGYPPTTFSKNADGYMLEIDHTIIFQAASAEDAIKHTTNYVEAREKNPDLPTGVIYGIYD